MLQFGRFHDAMIDGDRERSWLANVTHNDLMARVGLGSLDVGRTNPRSDALIRVKGWGVSGTASLSAFTAKREAV